MIKPAGPPASSLSRKPVWLRRSLGEGRDYGRTAASVRRYGLHTVCVSARCPNRGECWSRGTASFMLLGETCTRACGFCSVTTGRPAAPDRREPARVAAAVAAMGLRYVVLTSVNRDDLGDGGAGVFAQTLKILRTRDPRLGVEFLTPDFHRCRQQALAVVGEALDAGPAPEPALVWGHNVETVPRLYRRARKGADYRRSLGLLEAVARLPRVQAKSALMLGLGETRAEVEQVLRELRASGVRRIALGQYLRPTPKQLPVADYVPPAVFEELAAYCRELGFDWVKAGPFVRSSYHAETR